MTPQSDRIRIEDLLLRSHIGVNDWEREQKQDVILNITLHIDTRAAGNSDRIEDTVNYRSLAKKVIEQVEGSTYFLVEALAEAVAGICLSDRRVVRVDVSVDKPGALRFARSVGVTISRGQPGRGMAEARLNRAYLSLGSNVDKERNIVSAVRLLAEAVRIVAVSSVYETAPVGNPNQESFLNAAVVIETPLYAEALERDVLGPIEDRLGRRRTADKNAPRTIDIDIALFNEEVLDSEIATRAHLAVPLAEVAANYRLPPIGKTLSEIAAGLPHAGISRRSDLSLAGA